MIKAIKDFISYWYFRYLLATDLFMVEKWERATFRILFTIFFLIANANCVIYLQPKDVNLYIMLFIVLSIIYFFNATIILGIVRIISGWVFHKDIIKFDQNINEHIPI